MLEVCAHPDSKILRDSLLAMAHEGASADSLVNWMLGSFGEEYRAVPQARGSGLWAWIMPPLVLLFGLLLVVVVLRRLRRQAGPPMAPAMPLSPEEEAVLAEAREELRAAEEVPF
jgi:cytochrome c-type biogenesis protein CcmH/NrfF